MEKEELNSVLILHSKWLADNQNGVKADLTGANLAGKVITRKNLALAILDDANLTGVNFTETVLAGASFVRANLTDANLEEARLDGANLAGAIGLQFQIPQKSELIVWKKLRNGIIAKLRIPPEARRTATLINNKCRAEWAEVLKGDGIARYGRTPYRTGEIVKPDKYDDDIRIECTHGIHFFLTREEAEAY